MPCNLLVDKRKTSEEPCSERITSGGKMQKLTLTILKAFQEAVT